MSDIWTRERVMTLAPDAASATAGQGLARPGQWTTLGRADMSLWGEIKGSGSKPYQIRIDLTEPAFKCSCPSRKFPCKHGLGLLFIYAADPTALKSGEPPSWVSEWLAGRQDRAAKKVAKAEPAADAAPRDEEAAAKRAAAREKKIHAGLEELTRWMEDLLRQGLGSAQTQTDSFWEQMAARLVDAQAPGLARRVRDMGSMAFSGDSWQRRLLAALGRLSLLVTAYRRIGELPTELVADVRGEVGWTRPQEEVLAQDGTGDSWCVLAQRVTQEEQLRVQRTWLWGEKSARPALVLQFAAGTQPLDTSLQPGTRFEGELVFFPSAAPLRALVKTLSAARDSVRGIAGGGSVQDGLELFAAALARQPWLERWPLNLRDVRLIPTAVRSEVAQWALQDGAGRRLPVSVHPDVGWQLYAVSGGGPIDIFGEWDASAFTPWSASADGRLFNIASGAEQPVLVRVA